MQQVGLMGHWRGFYIFYDDLTIENEERKQHKWSIESTAMRIKLDITY